MQKSSDLIASSNTLFLFNIQSGFLNTRDHSETHRMVMRVNAHGCRCIEDEQKRKCPYDYVPCAITRKPRPIRYRIDEIASLMRFA